MTVRDYPRLPIEEFGAILLKSNDLDPTYVALHTLMSGGQMSLDHFSRWLLTYILCYHCGVACYLSDAPAADFYDGLEMAARNNEDSPAPTGERWPRSHERRHWRGAFATVVVQALRQQYPGEGGPKLWLQGLGAAEPAQHLTFRQVTERAQSHHGFGDWASFKLADLLDRLGLIKVDFSYDDVTVYKDPVLAAETLYRQKMKLSENATVKPKAVKDVFNYLIEHFSGYGAPPLYDRPVGVQEVETILCKWKSHNNGRYPVYNDIIEIHEGLVPWLTHSATARAFKDAMPARKEALSEPTAA